MRKIILIILLVSIVLISGCASSNNDQKNYANQTLIFRSDLLKADQVNVYPDEDAIKNVLFNESVKRVRIAYIPNDTENIYYLVDTFEIGNAAKGKLTMIYDYKFNKTVEMQSFPVNTTDEAKAFSSPLGPIILLLGPSHANETSITVNESLIIIQGKSFDETNRKYTDLDLAVDKMLLVLMGE